MELAVREVQKSFSGRSVLSGISFTLRQQEHTLLLGPSGSGKSTLINIICGLQAPDSGTVTLGDQAISTTNADGIRKRRMGIIFQSLRLVSALSVRANLTLAQKLQTGSTDERLTADTLERLGISHRADARPFQLSQGEAQRAAIARALVVRPQILIADEPTSALDHANAETVAWLLLELARDAEATLLIATHDDRLKAYFERTLLLHEGRMIA